jgi:uncharacterized repeat protein (TIGR01451 family)
MSSMKHNLANTPLLALFATLAIVLSVPALVRPTYAAQTYQNPAAISFGTGTSSPEPAALYPSPISVSGLQGSITSVTVTLSGFTHSFPDSVDIVLVGPDGKHALLMSDAGGATPLADVILTFADGALALPDGSAITTGTFRPTNYAPTDTFPAPGPGPLGLTPNLPLSIFNLTDPNGEWRLFAVEDTSGTSGAIGGWSLTITTADLAAEVSAAPESVNAGSLLTYDVTAHNFGTEAVADPTVTIAIPAGTTFQSVAPPAGWSCPPPAAGAASFTCTTPSFGSGGAPAFAVSVLVDKALAPGSTIARAATIGSTVPEAGTANNSATATTNVTTLADLAVLQVDSPADVNAGAELTIGVTVQNSGPSNGANAALTIPVPAGTSFVAVSAPDGWSCATPAVGASGDVVCSSAVFDTTTSSFSLRVKADPTLAPLTTIESSASITSGTADGAPNNNSATDTTTVATATDLAITVSAAPNPVSAAANLVYTIEVANNGPSNAAAANLATEVRSGTIFVALEQPEGWSCSTPAVGAIGAVSCDNPSFGVATATFRLTVQVLSGTPIGTQIAHSSAVSSATADTDSANNAAAATTEVTVAADLALTLEGVSDTVERDSTIAYALKLNNSGPEPAEAVTLTTSTPEHTTFVSFPTPAGWDCTTPAVGGAGQIVCVIPTLDVSTETLMLTVQLAEVPDGTTVTFNATAQSSTEDGAPENNAVSLTSTVVAPFRVFMPLVKR